MAIITIFIENAFINATIITEFVLESGPLLAGLTGPVPPALFLFEPSLLLTTYVLQVRIKKVKKKTMQALTNSTNQFSHM